VSGEKVVYRYRQTGAEEHHGSSSWKVAFADFAISMMSLFLVLWLVSVTNEVQKKSISAYFTNPGVFARPSSSSPVSMAGGATFHEGLPVFLRAVPSGKTGTQLNGNKASGTERLRGLASQGARGKGGSTLLGKRRGLEIRSLPQGVLISIVQSDQGPPFRSGSSQLEPFYEDLVLALARPVGLLRRRIVIMGHADTRGRGEGYLDGNWALAARRAETVRKTLVFGGLSFWQVASTVSVASLAPLRGYAGNDPLNRRVDIMLLSRYSERSLTRQQANYKPVESVASEQEWGTLMDAVKSNQRGAVTPLPRVGGQQEAGQGPRGQSVTGSL